MLNDTQALALTGAEWDTLADLEEQIEASIKQMDATWNALALIRDGKLYRATHKTFAEYLMDRWKFSRSRAYQLIGAAEDKLELSTSVDKAILDSMGEREFRAARLAPDGIRAEVITVAAERDGGTPTTKTIEAVVAEMTVPAAPAIEPVRRDDPEMLANLLKSPAGPAPVAIARPLSVSGHNTGEIEYYTPGRYVEAGRAVFGGRIGLDPATCEKAQRVIRAERFFTIADDGFAQPWEAESVWLNCPYGTDDEGSSNQGRWNAKLIAAYKAGAFREAITVVNALTYAPWFQQLWPFTICFTDHRITFDQPDEAAEKKSPRNGTAFVYLGPNPDRFAAHFAQFGAIVERHQAAIAAEVA